jgi:hypothetical protein
MAKNKISEWSSTPSNNTDVGGIDIAEGCAPSGINNGIREMMAQIKDMQSGADGDNFTVGGNLSVTGTTTLTGDVTAPTQISSDNSTKVATTAFVTSKVGTLGTMASQNASAVAITGGTMSGVTGSINSVTVGTNGGGTKTISSSAPSGGADGDIWYQVS